MEVIFCDGENKFAFGVIIRKFVHIKANPLIPLFLVFTIIKT